MRKILFIILTVFYIKATAQKFEWRVCYPDSTLYNLIVERPKNIIRADALVKNYLNGDSAKFRTYLTISSQPLQLYAHGDNTSIDSLLWVVYPKSANWNRVLRDSLAVILK